jgi:MFS transporter, PAT family, beta-lactamase induction signal transducer AmpG
MSTDARDLPLSRKLAAIALLYFIEGFPFGLVNDLLPVYFRASGVSLRQIGLLSLLGLPWSLKVLWSPLIDRYSERRVWIMACLLVMAVTLALVPLFPAGSIGWSLKLLLLALAVCSATQDIAIDAHTIGLLRRGEEGPANSVRVSLYRAALILSGGGMVALSGLFSWRTILLIASGLLLALSLSVRAVPRLLIPPEQRHAFFRPLWIWLKRPSALPVFLFVLLYKTGDASMAPMLKPFWLDRGLTPAQVGLISTTLGVAFSVAGAMLGGIWVARIGIFRGLWMLGLLQAFSNLGYACVAWVHLGHGALYTASFVESFTGGLGTAAFVSFLMNVCDAEHAGVQYALLSAIFGLSRSLAGSVSGWATERLGYASYFAFTFFLAFPAYLLLPWVKLWIRPAGAPGSTSGSTVSTD